MNQAYICNIATRLLKRYWLFRTLKKIIKNKKQKREIAHTHTDIYTHEIFKE